MTGINSNYGDANRPAPTREQREALLRNAWAELVQTKSPEELRALRNALPPKPDGNFVPYRQEEFHRRLAKRFMPTDGQAS